MDGSVHLPFEFDPNEPSPDWSRADKVHDWRNYVGAYTRCIWSTLTPEQRSAIALDADERSSYENWE